MTMPAGQADHAVMHPANRRADITLVEEAVLGAMARLGYPEASQFAIRLALEEALVNAFMHGHRGLPESETITVSYTATPKSIRIEVQDRGPGFDPAAVPDPTATENIELPSGRGLMLIRSFMTSVHHENNGSRLVMTYDKPAPE